MHRCCLVWLGFHSANCVATKFSGRFVESASFSSSSSSMSSSSSRRRFNDELLLLSSPCTSLPVSLPNCCVRKKCGSKKCACHQRNINKQTKKKQHENVYQIPRIINQSTINYRTVRNGFFSYSISNILTKYIRTGIAKCCAPVAPACRAAPKAIKRL